MRRFTLSHFALGLFCALIIVILSACAGTYDPSGPSPSERMLSAGNTLILLDHGCAPSGQCFGSRF